MNGSTYASFLGPKAFQISFKFKEIITFHVTFHYSGHGKFVLGEKFMPRLFGHWFEALKIVVGA